MEESLEAMTLTMLQERCQSEMRKVRGEAFANGRYCLEIFYRAIKKHDEQAWTLLVSSFRHLMMAWLYRHPERDRALLHDTTENYVDYAFSRFWQATTRNQTLTFQSLGAALLYLKASLDGAVKDTIRIHSRPILRLPEPGVENSFEEPAAEEEEDYGRELWEAIVDLLPSDREKRVAYLIIHCGLKPREIVRLLPDEFSNVYEIYRTYRNIDDRLKRNTNRLRWRLNDQEE
jgi:hypothetical protein